MNGSGASRPKTTKSHILYQKSVNGLENEVLNKAQYIRKNKKVESNEIVRINPKDSICVKESFFSPRNRILLLVSTAWNHRVNCVV